MGEKNNITAAQRAANFALATRQNQHTLFKNSVDGGAQSITFQLPKNRLLSKIYLKFDIDVDIKHASSTSLPALDKLAPYRLIRRLSMDFNSGFQPYVVSGVQLALFNLISHYQADYILNFNSDDANPYCHWIDKGVSSSGKLNKISFMLEMPITLNDRDAISLILLQNDQTLSQVIIDVGNGSDLFNGNGNDYTADIKKCTVELTTETFSIPASQDAFPDLSVLKLTHGRNDSFTGSGQHILKLSTGTIYRRMILLFEDENGNALSDDDLTAPFELVFNQADINYSINPKVLRCINTEYYGMYLPKGVYVFDFAYQGNVNLGGTRDYIDTERLTEFWFRFTSTKSCRINIVHETISRLT